jgi:hypothetical protein
MAILYPLPASLDEQKPPQILGFRESAGWDSNLQPSGYEPEPGVPLDYVGHGFKRFREIEIGWDRLESVGLLAPFLAPARTRQRMAVRMLRSAAPLLLAQSGSAAKSEQRCRSSSKGTAVSQIRGRVDALFRSLPHEFRK